MATCHKPHVEECHGSGCILSTSHQHPLVPRPCHFWFQRQGKWHGHIRHAHILASCQRYQCKEDWGEEIFLGIRPLFIWLDSCAVVLMEILAHYVDLAGLDWKQWIVCFGISMVSWPVGFAIKFCMFASWSTLSWLFSTNWWHCYDNSQTKSLR